jgi:hypothetical protein
VAEYLYDRVKLGASLCELRADCVPEPVGRHGAAAVAAASSRADEAGGLAGDLDRVSNR